MIHNNVYLRHGQSSLVYRLVWIISWYAFSKSTRGGLHQMCWNVSAHLLRCKACIFACELPHCLSLVPLVLRKPGRCHCVRLTETEPKTPLSNPFVQTLNYWYSYFVMLWSECVPNPARLTRPKLPKVNRSSYMYFDDAIVMQITFLYERIFFGKL